MRRIKTESFPRTLRTRLCRGLLTAVSGLAYLGGSVFLGLFFFWVSTGRDGKEVALRLLILLIESAVVGCARSSENGIMAPSCAKTPITVSDMAAFGFKPEAGKIVVTRLFASWCPYCKNDLQRIGALYKDGKWTPQTVRLFLLAYHNHSEDRATFD